MDNELFVFLELKSGCWCVTHLVVVVCIDLICCYEVEKGGRVQGRKNLTPHGFFSGGLDAIQGSENNPGGLESILGVTLCFNLPSSNPVAPACRPGLNK